MKKTIFFAVLVLCSLTSKSFAQSYEPTEENLNLAMAKVKYFQMAISDAFQKNNSEKNLDETMDETIEKLNKFQSYLDEHDYSHFEKTSSLSLPIGGFCFLMTKIKNLKGNLPESIKNIITTLGSKQRTSIVYSLIAEENNGKFFQNRYIPQNYRETTGSAQLTLTEKEFLSLLKNKFPEIGEHISIIEQNHFSKVGDLDKALLALDKWLSNTENKRKLFLMLKENESFRPSVYSVVKDGNTIKKFLKRATITTAIVGVLIAISVYSDPEQHLTEINLAGMNENQLRTLFKENRRELEAVMNFDLATLSAQNL